MADCKPLVEKVAVTAGYTLHLTPEEAITMRTILRHVAGNFDLSARKYASDISSALSLAGVPHLGSAHAPTGVIDLTPTTQMKVKYEANKLSRGSLL